MPCRKNISENNKMENPRCNWIRWMHRKNHQVLNAGTYFYLVFIEHANTCQQWWFNTNTDIWQCACVCVFVCLLKFSIWNLAITLLACNRRNRKIHNRYHIWSFTEQIKHFGFRFYSFVLNLRLSHFVQTIFFTMKCWNRTGMTYDEVLRISFPQLRSIEDI